MGAGSPAVRDVVGATFESRSTSNVLCTLEVAGRVPMSVSLEPSRLGGTTSTVALPVGAAAPDKGVVAVQDDAEVHVPVNNVAVIFWAP